MNDPRWEWSGARWWKFDLHTHTPASDDYGEGPDQAALKARTPREWLLDYMRGGLDCVAVTDHNSGAWIDQLKAALQQLEADKPDCFRPLTLFPGVEISVNGGVHVLALLSQEKSTSDLDSLVGAVGFDGTKGSSNAVTNKSFVEVVQAIKATGGLAIPAHVDGPRGVFNALFGTTLEQVLGCMSIFAMEIVDPSQPKPQLYLDRKLGWTEVLGSDAHHPSGTRSPGSHFTWIKMGTPSLDGLRLALLDGPLSVRRSEQVAGDPNQHAPLVLESIEITKARYMGRANPFAIELNPWLNAIIGGRGTGKSTLVEFLRTAMRREAEIPEALEADLAKYRKVYESRSDDGVLTDDTEFIVTYRKDLARFRLQWSQDGNLDPIQEERADGTWGRAEGDIPQRFPVRIYSQKQIFQLAKAPLALLRIVDDAPKVGRHAWGERWKEEETRFLSLRAKARELDAGLSEEPRLRGELDDVTRKLAAFESAGHAEVLKSFQKRQRQQRAVEAWSKTWADSGERIRQLAGELLSDPLDASALDLDSPQDVALHERAQAAHQSLEAIRRALDEMAGKADQVIARWKADSDASAWKQAVDAASRVYEELKKRLATEGAGDPAAYGELVHRRQTIELRLKDLVARRQQVVAIRAQADAGLGRLLVLRRELTRARDDFIKMVLEGNKYVMIRVLPYGATETVEVEFRRLVQRETGGFEKDIGSPDEGGLLGKIYAGQGSAQAIETALAAVKRDVRAVAAGQSNVGEVRDQRFAAHLGKLPPEVLDRLDLWFPEDSLDVQYSTSSDGQSFRSIQEGSPGQKTAALLAFLLSYGEEPLILDQPEDDLDNHLIYDLIVTQIRDVKQRRQLLVVTHNANIVVNGDAELVVALVPRNGETKQECAGSLQEREVRETICAVMEGGRKAFEQRYRRIALEARHV